MLNMTSVHAYIDFEGKQPHLLEVCVLVTERHTPIRLFHRIILPPNLHLLDSRQAKYCHCIPKWYVKQYGTPLHKVKEELYQLFDKLPHVEICGYGDDSTKEFFMEFLPLMDLTHKRFRQVELLPWKQRDSEPSHLRAQEMRQSWYKQWPCDAHSLPHVTNSEEKRRHGPHCAVTDCFELFMVNTKTLLRQGDLYKMSDV